MYKRSGVGEACRLLALKDAARRKIYRQLAADARRRGERSISYSAWVNVLRRVCKLEKTDPGGNITL